MIDLYPQGGARFAATPKPQSPVVEKQILSGLGQDSAVLFSGKKSGWSREDADKMLAMLGKIDALKVPVASKYYALEEKVDALQERADDYAELARELRQRSAELAESQPRKAKRLAKKAFDKEVKSSMKGLAAARVQGGRGDYLVDANVKSGKHPLHLQRESLQAGRPIPANEQYWYGIVRPESVTASSADFDILAGALREAVGAEKIPASGLPLAIRRSDNDKSALGDFLNDDLRPALMYESREKDETGMPEVTETILWQFFDYLISGREIPEGYPQLKALQEKVDELPLFQLQCPDDPALEAELREKFAPVRRRLLGLELANQAYVDEVNIKEVGAALATGSIVGGGGETLVHTFLNAGSWMATVGRSVVLLLTDGVDNVAGEMGNVEADMRQSGKRLNLKNIFGVNNWKQAFKQGFKIRGEARPFVKKARISAANGALRGVPTAFVGGWANSVVGLHPALIPVQALAAGVGTMGTGLGIADNLNRSLFQVQEAIEHKVDEGLIILPEDVANEPDADVKAEKKKTFVEGLTKQELLSRLGFSASNKAFFTGPTISTLLFMSQFAGVPLPVIVALYMVLSPSAENLSRMGYTAHRLTRGMPKEKAELVRLILENPQGFDAAQQQLLARKFANGFSSKTYDILTHEPSTRRFFKEGPVDWVQNARKAWARKKEAPTSAE